MTIRRLGPDDVAVVMGAGHLFDSAPEPAWTKRFLETPGHHLLMAFADDAPAGFVTGVETTHPDKGTEMFLYELSVAPEHRGRGIGRSLVAALETLARERGCYGMWVATESENAAAIATYRSAGASEPEPVVTFVWTFGSAG